MISEWSFAADSKNAILADPKAGLWQLFGD
jgi:hypothetical protein